MDIFRDFEYELMDINLDDVDFTAHGFVRVHDWRKYVPDDWQKNWMMFSERERKIIFVLANRQAQAEEWD